MPVIDVSKDPASLNLTIVAGFAAPVQRIRDLFADPRQIERVWASSSHPATFDDHALTVGARTTDVMTGPDRGKCCGYGTVTRFEAIAGGTRATYASTFTGKKAPEQILAMGVVEGAASAINQIDGLPAG